MKTNNFFHILFFSAITVVMSACVPKATEKKAVCGAGQSFNSISRSCVSVAESRTRPTGLLSADTLTQETAKTITLTYNDGNNDSALSCRVTAVSPNIEAISPQVINGGLLAKADLVFYAAQDAYNTLPLGADRDAALIKRDNMLAALNFAKTTFTHSNLLNQLGLFITAANDILTITAPYTFGYTAVKYYSDLTVSRIAEYNTVKTFVDNRCDCSGGVCTTTIAPRMHESGAAGFTYTITDKDGEGEARVVSLSIAASSPSSAYLAPAVESNYVATFTESANSTPSTYAFTLPVARDYFGTSTFGYTFNGSKNGSNYGLTASGKVSSCMDLIGSTGTTDTTCIYTPNSGDANDSAVPTAAQAVIGSITFTAKANGTFANNFTIQYFDLQNDNTLIDSHVTKSESFGLVSQTYADTFVRVSGNAIQVFLVNGITKSSDIVSLINADAKAKSLVLASLTGADTFPNPGALTPAAVTLAGGSDAFDTISYTASNGYASSTNAANVMVKISAVDDPPYMNYAVATPTNTALEDGGAISIDLSGTYADVDGTVTACDIHVAGVDPSVDPLVETTFLANFTVNSCTCVAGACTASVTPAANVSSTTAFNFYYRVTSTGLNSDYRMGEVIVTPVNDVPNLAAIGVQTILENSTAAPSSGSVMVGVDVGGGSFESTQTLTLALSSSNTTLLPNTSCQNYTPGAGSPSGVVTPAAAGVYYFDTTSKSCYVSTGTTNTSWALHPSLTAYPKCAYDYYGQGAPAVTPSAAGKHYLDTTNNKCYKSSAATVASWAIDNTLTDFYVAYVPVVNQSGSATITMTLTDNGGTTNGGVDSVVGTFVLNVTSVDDPPYFLSTIIKADTNEGGMVVAGPFKVDEDQGSSTDEDAQGMSVTALTSDNTSVLPTSAITIFYDLNDNGVEDSGEARALAATLESAAGNDSKLHSFYLKLNPIAGVSGNANITMTVSDGTNTANTTFSLIVHPIAALHGGWANISAIGIKTDKNGAPAADADVECNYNTSADFKACNTNQNCTGVDSPTAVVIPDEAGVLYWDSANNKCYRSTGSDKFSWVEFKTTCPVTRVNDPAICSRENCIATLAPTPTAVGQYYYNTSSSTCYISTGTAAGNWIAYTPSKVTLTWNAFTVSGSGADATVTIYGWNVYRREKGYDYDFTAGFLKTNSAATMTISDPTVKTFTDTTAVAGKVYYYLVRPVDSSSRHLTISTPDVFSEVRIMAPTENYAFVHRWMVNQEICNSMHMTTTTTDKVDPTHNYRCPYKGPGESTIAPGYYDIEKDMLVDISESGCPYSAAPKCTANGCVGIGDPTTLGVTGMAANDVYYDRSSGACYMYDGAAWSDYNSAVLNATIVAKTNTALNAPLTNITKARASAVCQARSTASVAANLGIANGAVSNPPAAPSLPTKKEYIAYSAAPYNMSDSLITDMEQGFSLNVQSRCNSSSANGIDSAFTDSSIPSTSYIFSLPGTASSGIKSIYTGSVPWGMNFSTESCSSRYGVQDVYGNVAEWMQESMTCANRTNTTLTAAITAVDVTINVTSTTGFPGAGTLMIGTEEMTYAGTTPTTFTGVVRGTNATTAAAHTTTEIVYLNAGSATEYVCTTVAGAGTPDLARYDFLNGGYAAAPANRYAFDYVTGPYNDTNADSLASQGDGFLTSWDFRDELFGAGKFSFPMGMPMYVDIGTGASAIAGSVAIPYLLDIGPTAGITTSQLHEDGITINGIDINDMTNNPTQTGSFAQGGSYLSGNRSGRYSSELIPDAAVSPDVGFRCYIPIINNNYPADTGRHTYSY